jgi:hypothetical protein
MGTTSSSTAHPAVTEDSESPHISTQSDGVKRSKVPEMALAFDAQAHHPDDLNHDTLMGLQELDSHLSIFEKTAVHSRDLSTSDSLSDVLSDDFNTIEVTPIAHFNEQRNIDSYRKASAPASPRRSTKHVALKSNGISKYATPSAITRN